jgi:hypothetical protein
MKLKLEWEHQVPLVRTSRQQLGYTVALEKVPEAAGIYIFGRKFGKKVEALYVGKAANIRRRIKGHFNNLRLMNHLHDARMGRRVLLVARFVSGPGQNAEKCLRILERALIRYFLSEGHDLVNKQGTRLHRHEVESSGSKRVVPSLMFVDRVRGE